METSSVWSWARRRSSTTWLVRCSRETGRIYAIESQRSRTGKSNNLKLKINFLPEIITLSKEVSHFRPSLVHDSLNIFFENIPNLLSFPGQESEKPRLPRSVSHSKQSSSGQPALSVRHFSNWERQDLLSRRTWATDIINTWVKVSLLVNVHYCLLSRLCFAYAY